MSTLFFHCCVETKTCAIRRVKYWEIIADNLKQSRLELGRKTLFFRGTRSTRRRRSQSRCPATKRPALSFFSFYTTSFVLKFRYGGDLYLCDRVVKLSRA